MKVNGEDIFKVNGCKTAINTHQEASAPRKQEFDLLGLFDAIAWRGIQPQQKGPTANHVSFGQGVKRDTLLSMCRRV